MPKITADESNLESPVRVALAWRERDIGDQYPVLQEAIFTIERRPSKGRRQYRQIKWVGGKSYERQPLDPFFSGRLSDLDSYISHKKAERERIHPFQACDGARKLNVLEVGHLIQDCPTLFTPKQKQQVRGKILALIRLAKSATPSAS